MVKDMQTEIARKKYNARKVISLKRIIQFQERAEERKRNYGLK